MIAILEGTIFSRELDHVICMVQGVGYRVFVPGGSFEFGDSAQFFIYDHVREDRRELYGFTSPNALRLFKKLIDVSGIGPRLAQKMLSQASAESVERHIIQGDVSFFEGISGVGKKTAQKIILELQGSLVMDTEEDGDADAVEALVSLGYQKRDAIELLKETKGTTTEEKIREVLQSIGRVR